MKIVSKQLTLKQLCSFLIIFFFKLAHKKILK